MVAVNIALGSNLGDPQKNLEIAALEIGRLGQVIAKSRLYLTKPWGVVEQPDFCNAVLQLETKLSPRELLIQLKDIEKRMGRTETVRWGPRLIDLDILTYENVEVDEPGLTLPHPRMNERAFVLVPLCDVDQTFDQVRAALPSASLDEVQLSEESW